MTFPDLLDAIWFHRSKTYKNVIVFLAAIILFLI